MLACSNHRGTIPNATAAADIAAQATKQLAAERKARSVLWMSQRCVHVCGVRASFPAWSRVRVCTGYRDLLDHWQYSNIYIYRSTIEYIFTFYFPSSHHDHVSLVTLFHWKQRRYAPYFSVGCSIILLFEPVRIFILILLFRFLILHWSFCFDCGFLFFLKKKILSTEMAVLVLIEDRHQPCEQRACTLQPRLPMQVKGQHGWQRGKICLHWDIETLRSATLATRFLWVCCCVVSVSVAFIPPPPPLSLPPPPAHTFFIHV